MKEQVNVKIRINSQEVFMVNPSVALTAETGSHTKVIVHGIVKEESHRIVAEAGPMTEIQIQTGENTDYFFWGVITYIDVQIRMSEGYRYQELCLEAMSATCRLDQKKEYGAFQKKGASYSEIFDIVLREYSEAGYIFSSELSGRQLDRLTVQYEETDWEFLSRIVSFLHLPLAADHKTGGIKFTAGVVWKTNVYEIPAAEEWQAEVIQDEYRYLSWQSENPDTPIFEVGDCIRYRGNDYYVKRTEMEIKDNVLNQTCLLYTKEGFYVTEIENPFLTGLSLPGSVKEVKGNQLRITLDIDTMEESDCWYVYSTFYSTFYCMPEKGDRINLYFPDHIEDHAFVLNSVRSEPSETMIASSDGKGSISESGSDSGNSVLEVIAQTGQQAVKTIDVSPYLAMLAAPENGKLINVTATMREDSVNAAEGGQSRTDGGNGNGGNASGTPTSGIAGAAQKSYDFQAMAQNENIKILCTKNGRMVILDDDSNSVSVVCSNGTYIALEESGISIVTDEKIVFQASKDIRLKAGAEMFLSAEESIQIKCKDTKIDVLPQKISIEGTDILLNEE